MRNLGLLIVSLVVALAFVGCGGADEPPPKLPSVLAEQLAQRADAVAALLEAGDACAAATEASALERAVARAIAEGRVPRPLERELRAAAAELVAAIQCVPAPAPDEDEEPAQACEALEQQKQALEDRKQQIEEEFKERKEERERLKAQIEAQKESIKRQIEACKERDG